jgi:RND family efflux transporter MFP subunit
MKRTVDAGSNVRKGQILAQLDDREFRNSVKLALARIAELEARWKQAGRDRRRFEALAQSDVISVADLEKITTQEAALAASLKAASARLNEARRLLGETVLKAPFSGTVTGLLLQPGEWAVPGQPVIELTGSGEIELLVEVPETIVGHLAADQVIEIELPFSRGRRVQGRIDAVAKAALTGGRLFPVKVDLAPEPEVKAGLTAQLIVDLSTEGVLTVPLASVVNPGGSQPYIFIYQQGRVAKRPVTVEGIVADRVIIRGEIAEGDRVVTSGQSRLAHGDPVEVLS